MDIIELFSRLEREFFSRLGRKNRWVTKEVRVEFSEAIKNTLITTHSRIMKDAEKARIEEDDS